MPEHGGERAGSASIDASGRLGAAALELEDGAVVARAEVLAAEPQRDARAGAPPGS